MKSLRLYLIIAGVLLIVYIVAQLNRPKAVDWSETLSSKEKAPFGTYILNNRLKDIFPKSTVVNYRKPIYNVLAEDSLKDATYIIICPEIELTKADYGKLSAYLNKGNDVFIVANYFGKAFEKYLKVKTASDFKINRDAYPVNFINPALKSPKGFTVDRWAGIVYFSGFDTLKTTVLGDNEKHRANFIKYRFGKGSLYLASVPKLFTNYSLLKPAGAAYAGIALSYLKPTKKIAVDEYYTQGQEEYKSPMRVFLSHATLQWAYYITLFSLLLFVLFEIKRRQRIIPVIEPLTNSSLDFVNVVGQVYYEQRNNTDIAHKKILYFFNKLRDQYQLKTNITDNDFAETLAAKTNVDFDFIKKLIFYINQLTNQQRVSDHELIELNKLIEEFYIKAR